MVTTSFTARLHFPDGTSTIERFPELPDDGAEVLDGWIVTRREVCEGEVVVDDQRIDFELWVEPKQT